MKPAFKYAIISLLYKAGEEGMWEYDIYDILKGKYEKAALCGLREDLISFNTIGWLSVVAIREYEGKILRKFRFQQRHKPFIDYHMDVDKLLNSIGIMENPQKLVAAGREE